VKVVNLNHNKANQAIDALNGTLLLNKPVCLSLYEPEYKSGKINSLLVKNIPKDTSSRQFYEICKEFGEVKKCRLELDYYGGSKGYGYVSYANSNDTAKDKLKVIYQIVIPLGTWV
jgi:RNA recognition motif-containing protein